MPVKRGLNDDPWFTWILDNHWDFAGATRTEIGQLVYKSKYLNDSSATLELESIARHSILQISRFAHSGGPSAVECVIAVPSSSRPNDASTLPRKLAKVVSRALGVPDASQKVAITPGLEAAKNRAVREAKDFSIPAYIAFESVLLVDDLLSTGQTMVALGECLGAHRSQIRLSGFALTKVQKGLGN